MSPTRAPPGLVWFPAILFGQLGEGPAASGGVGQRKGGRRPPTPPYPSQGLNRYFCCCASNQESCILRRHVICNFDVIVAFNRSFWWVRGRAKNLDYPLGHDMELELVCGADIWCNRHCAASRARFRARGPARHPEYFVFVGLLLFVFVIPVLACNRDMWRNPGRRASAQSLFSPLPCSFVSLSLYPFIERRCDGCVSAQKKCGARWRVQFCPYNHH